MRIEERPLIYIMLFAAFLLRVWALDWALPLKYAHIDESVVIFYTMRFFTGDFNPHVFFDYPTLFLYFLGLVFYVYFLVGHLFGAFAGLDQFVGMYMFGNSSLLYVLARLVSATLGAATIYITYKVGKENTGSGFAPALMLAVLPLHVLHSHYATVDIAAVFFLMLSFLYLARFVNREEVLDLYKGAFLIGIATAVKYYPAVFFVPVAAFAVFRKPKPVLYACGLAASGFILGCPFAVIGFKEFASRFADRFFYIVWGSGAAPTSGSGAFSFQPIGILKTLIGIMTPPLFALSIIGTVLYIIFVKNKLGILLWTVTPLFFVTFLASWKIVSPHYILPAVPFLLIGGAAGFSSLPLLKNNGWLKIALFAGILIAPAYQSIKADISLAKQDTRITAYDWAKINIPAGSRILRMPFTPEFSPKDPYMVRVDWQSKMRGVSPAEFHRDYDYVIVSAFSNDPVDQWENSLLEFYALKYRINSDSLTPFHHPRISIYGKQN